MRFLGIKAVIFDFDGTLVDSMSLWKEIDRIFLKKLGFEVPEGLQKEIAGLSFSETAHYFRKRFNIRQSVEEIKGEWTRLSKEIYRDQVSFRECARELINSFKECGILCAVGSSNEKELIVEYMKTENYLMRFL